ncbi:hypothetical protein OE88DRAFT_1643292 [Heliocybe sulcata]|uniref:cAMP-independent regulatory protein pac2 n=1 Tax=Heliocybe sulcata TaxID=5364 RepID=A0A5C3NC36_9AGAM|nr:hypothetical protein OE88DRAFT_1643292 [Heliocybe sulcata]
MQTEANWWAADQWSQQSARQDFAVTVSSKAFAYRAMQQPTLRNFRLRNVQDALRVFYACYLGILPLITRRLDNEERQQLRPGDAYVWEGRNPETDVSGLGIERWTEGKKWSQSRVREDLLYYYEKFHDGHTPHAAHRLIRQTYSAALNDPGRDKARKLGLSTYYTENSLRHLHTVDDIPELRDLVVPEGLFVRERKINQKSSRSLSSASAQNYPTPGATQRHGESHRHAVPRTYAPYPVPTSSSFPSESSQDFHPYHIPPQSHLTAFPYSSSQSAGHGGHGHHELTEWYWAPADAEQPTPNEMGTDSVSSAYGYHHPSYYYPQPSNELYNSSPSSSTASIHREEPSPIESAVNASMRRQSPPVHQLHEEGRSPPASSPSTGTPYAVPRDVAPLPINLMVGAERGSIGGPVYLAPLSDLRKESTYHRDPADDWALRLLDQKQDCLQH